VALTFGAIDIYIWPNWVGGDALLYTRAARAWLGGGNPWAASVLGFRYAAPPSSWLPFVPLAWLPDGAVVPLAWAGCLVAGLYAVRRLGLAPWWILFPPLAQAIWNGNLNVLVLALLVAEHPIAEALAVGCKIYAVVPLILRGRWRGLVLTAALGLASWAVLPWGTYLAHFGAINGVLLTQSQGYSVWPNAIAVAVALPALWVLGRERSAWLAVPLLWPASQFDYAALALPALTGLTAITFAVPVPMVGPAGVLLQATLAQAKRMRPRLQRPADDPKTDPDRAVRQALPPSSTAGRRRAVGADRPGSTQR
jgi:hypothetical protein